MKAPCPADRRKGRLRAGVYVVLYLAGVMVFASASAVLAHDLLAGAEKGLAGWLNEQGPGRILRRILLLSALPGLARPGI